MIIFIIITQRDQAMLEEEKELLEERVRELTIQLEQAQHSKVDTGRAGAQCLQETFLSLSSPLSLWLKS